MTNWKKKNAPAGLSTRANVEKLLILLECHDPAKGAMYRKAQSSPHFAAAYREADKDLPICAECGANCLPILAARDFAAEFWSHCCLAPIEQDAGREP